MVLLVLIIGLHSWFALLCGDNEGEAVRIKVQGRPIHRVQYGTVQGLVLDDAGDAIQKASVVAKNVETGLKLTAVTDKKGYFRILVPVGTYQLMTTARQFSSSRLDVNVGAADVRDLTIRLYEHIQEDLNFPIWRDPDAFIRAQIDKLAQGLIAFNPSEQMQVDQNETLEVRISRSLWSGWKGPSR